MTDMQPESRYIETAREKLKLKIQRESRRFTPEAIERAISTIKRSISRHHAPGFLKNKEFTLFDENLHPAKVKSRQIAKLKSLLSVELSRPFFNFRGKQPF